MVYLCFLLFLIFLYMICDVNYILRTIFSVISGRLEKTYTLSDVTAIYGFGIFQDCDVDFKRVRLARLLREIDFARYHFYDRTGIYTRSRQLRIHSLQGSTLTESYEPVPLFVPYKINTKLVFWDEKSLFLEHEVETLWDRKVRCLLVSRQYVISDNKYTTDVLLKDLPGFKANQKCPQYIKKWLQSMQISSEKLRHVIKKTYYTL